MCERPRLNLLLVSNHRRFKIHFRAYPWARALAARGHRVTVMCHADTERWRTRIEHADGFRIVHNPDVLVGALRQGWDPICALRRRRFLFREDERYDLIHCLDTRPAVILPALAYARHRQVPIVSDWIDWWGRGGLIAERRPSWYRLLFGGFETYFEEAYRQRLHGLTAISSALVERGVALGVPRETCLRIPGGANLEAFASAPARAVARHALGLPADAPVVCFSGLDVLIDLELVTRTFERIVAEMPDARLLLVGPRRADVATLLPPRVLETRTVITGPIPYGQLAGVLAAADLFLMPYTSKISNIGRWPNKIGDYMCMGRPTVSNPVGEVKTLFEERGVGVLAGEDAEAMAAQALALLREPARADAIGRAARRAAERDFSWHQLVLPLEQWYYDIIERRRSHLPAA